MRARITTWPKVVNRDPVSTTMSPVTQVAEVAVNSESVKDSGDSVEAWGKESKIQPTVMAPKKLRITIREG